MDTIMTHLLGYLDEKQWLDALERMHNRQRVKDLAYQIYIHYNFCWSEKAVEKLGLPKD